MYNKQKQINNKLDYLNSGRGHYWQTVECSGANENLQILILGHLQEENAWDIWNILNYLNILIFQILQIFLATRYKSFHHQAFLNLFWAVQWTGADNNHHHHHHHYHHHHECHRHHHRPHCHHNHHQKLNHWQILQ